MDWLPVMVQMTCHLKTPVIVQSIYFPGQWMQFCLILFGHGNFYLHGTNLQYSVQGIFFERHTCHDYPNIVYAIHFISVLHTYTEWQSSSQENKLFVAVPDIFTAGLNINANGCILFVLLTLCQHSVGGILLTKCNFCFLHNQSLI